ncbi:hypothetical protein KFZ76_20860 [Methylovulum psychrotolerans]|uniref:hypothetical protein n=1 Tax=Methylovulum psychrotolerans TaxID=1704499 RepID=UPI001BFF92A2|nr:hypothetical protein [Methylovulum psychrotolerans]MBT9100158.1 hypothetical protein [Methylovulum psychrotolerans]
MIITLENGKTVRGDLLKKVVVRSDLAPIPLTFEGQIRVTGDTGKYLAEGRTLTVNQDVFKIIANPEDTKAQLVQGKQGVEFKQVIALLNNCHTAAFISAKAIIKEKTSLAAIYKAAGAGLAGIDGDVTVPYFCCLAGSCPTFPLAQVLQEQGGVLRWKNGKMAFFRIGDLFNQKPVLTLPDTGADTLSNGFLARHTVPSFYSLADDGSFIYGNRDKTRSSYYVPNKNAQQLQNMSRCLIRRKIINRIDLAPAIAAGDLIGFAGGQALAVITAAHVFESDGAHSKQYTRLWLGEALT